MGSTFSGIELGKRSIMAHTDAITTAGHNISNANILNLSFFILSPRKVLYIIT